MRAKAIIVVFFGMMLGAAAIASEQHQHVAVKIKVKEQRDADAREFRFDSHAAGFNLHELQLGESRSFVDAEGNNLFVVRTADGFDFNLDGKEFSIPALVDDNSVAIKLHVDGEAGEHHVIKRVIKIETDDENEVDVTN
jgi:hypothetical protein